MSNGTIITLPQEIWNRATEHGYERDDNNVRKGNPPGFKPRNRTIRENHAFGARGEAAFSYFLYDDWKPAPLRGIDVGRYEVRTTDYGDAWLKFMEWQDKKINVPFALVVDLGSRKYRIAGWLYGYEIMEIGRAKNQREDTNRPRPDAHNGKLMMWSYAKQEDLHLDFPEKMVLDTSEHM